MRIIFILLLFHSTAQFGSWNYGPQHGFARIIRWHVEKAPERLPSGDIEAIFCIVDNEITRSTWNYQWVNTVIIDILYVVGYLIRRNNYTAHDDDCVLSGFDCPTDLSSGKRNFTLTLASTIRVKTSHFHLTFYCTPISKCPTWGDVKSLAFRDALLSTRFTISQFQNQLIQSWK